MTNETILTDEEIIMIGKQARAIESGENGYILPVAFARAIEQAVLQAERKADVAALVEALTELCDEIDKHEIHTAISKTSISWFKRKARTALTQEQS